LIFQLPRPRLCELVTGGEVFRSGACYSRGKGKIFYFRPGHETLPPIIIPMFSGSLPMPCVGPHQLPAHPLSMEHSLAGKIKIAVCLAVLVIPMCWWISQGLVSPPAISTNAYFRPSNTYKNSFSNRRNQNPLRSQFTQLLINIPKFLFRDRNMDRKPIQDQP